METTSEKLTYLNTTKSKIKDSINLTGANILSTDTFRSYATKLKNGLVNIINNGIDTLYDSFPKVTAEGTEIVLNNTYEAPLKVNVIKGDTQQDDTPTPDTPQEVKVVTGLQNVSVSDGTNTTNYEVDLGTLELCKINDYQDTLQKSSGKNLFDKNNVTLNYRIDPSGNEYSDNNCFVSGYIPIDANTRYTFNVEVSTWECMSFYTSDKTFISRITTYNSYTSPNNASYLRICAYKINIDILQLEKNNQSTEYEPYGKVWYKKANIGKVALDGSNDENWTYGETNTSGYGRFNCAINNIPNIDANTVGNNLSDKFIAVSRGDTWLNRDGIASGQNFLQIYSDVTKEMSVAEFRTWLSSNNVIAYYQLATPTYTEITDTTLINQLESIKSKNNQTNITISGNLPMIINASALEKE